LSCEKVARLHEELNRPELRTEAAAAIRGLIEAVRLVPENGIELAGDLAGILALTSDNPAVTCSPRPSRWLRGPATPDS
jgi:hypothetical protein